MRSNTMLYLIPREGPNTNARLVGIRRAASVLGYQVEKIMRQENDLADVRELIAFWHADACLVECAGTEAVPSPRLFGRTPALFIDCDPERLPDSASCLYCAGDETAQLAARALINADAATYVFARPASDFYWSRARERAFIRAMRLNGHTVEIVQSSRTGVFDLNSIRGLARSFAEMTRPIGVFAANDFVADDVMAAAKEANLKIPAELSVVGVDDNEGICEHTSPPLTSIRLDFEKSGEEAFRMAYRLMRSRKAALRETYDAMGLIPRGSCPGTHCGDHRVLTALNFIRAHLAEPIAIPDVVRAMGCSRRTAELRFRATRSRSILEEIRHMRLEQARLIRSMRKDLSLDDLARQVGYANRSALWKLFKGR